MRGFLGGVLLALLLGAVAFVAVAVLTPMPETPVVDTETPAPAVPADEAPAASDETESMQDQTQDGSVTEAAEAPEAIEEPAPETSGSAVAAIPTTSEPDLEPATESPDPAPADAPETDVRPPLERFATPFDNPEGRPLLSVVLIDAGDVDTSATLWAFPYPLSIAVDPAGDAATARMDRLRAAGFEVVALVDLPSAATPADAEIAIAGTLRALSEAVALFEAPGADLPRGGALDRQIAAIAGADGLGLLREDRGPAAGVTSGDAPSAAYQLLQSGDGGPEAIRRALDRVALRASQTGQAVVAAPLNADVVNALAAWARSSGAERMVLAPVSAILGAGRP
jgi:hypothetical protein